MESDGSWAHASGSTSEATPAEAAHCVGKAGKGAATGKGELGSGWPKCSSWADATDSDEDLSHCLAIWSRQTTDLAEDDDDDINAVSDFSRQGSNSSSGSYSWADATDCDEDLIQCLAVWSRQASAGADEMSETSLFERQGSTSSSSSWHVDEAKSQPHSEMPEVELDEVQTPSE